MKPLDPVTQGTQHEYAKTSPVTKQALDDRARLMQEQRLKALGYKVEGDEVKK